MKKLIFIFILFQLSFGAVDTLVRHDTIFVKTQEIHYQCPEPKDNSTLNKICGAAMIVSGTLIGTANVVQLSCDPGRNYGLKEGKDSGIYAISFGFSIGMIAQGINLFFRK